MEGYKSGYFYPHTLRRKEKEKEKCCMSAAELGVEASSQGYNDNLYKRRSKRLLS